MSPFVMSFPLLYPQTLGNGCAQFKSHDKLMCIHSEWVRFHSLQISMLELVLVKQHGLGLRFL